MLIKRLSLVIMMLDVFNHSSITAQVSIKDSILYSHYWNKIQLAAVASKGDYLYAGIDNIILLTFPDERSRQFHIELKTQNGYLSKDENGYLTIPVHAGRSFFSVMVITAKNDTISLGKKQFIVKNVPYPILQMKKVIIDDQKLVPRSTFCCGDSLQLYFTDDLPESKSWYLIQSFTINYNYGGVTLSFTNEGPVLTKESKEFLDKLAPGKEIVFKVVSVSPDNMLRYLPLIRFKIQ